MRAAKRDENAPQSVSELPVPSHCGTTQKMLVWFDLRLLPGACWHSRNGATVPPTPRYVPCGKLAHAGTVVSVVSGYGPKFNPETEPSSEHKNKWRQEVSNP